MPAKPRIIMAQVEGSGTAPTPGPVRVKLPELSLLNVSLTVKVRVGFSTENDPNPKEDRELPANVSEVGGKALPSPFAIVVGKICSVPTPAIVSRSEPNVVLPFKDEPPTPVVPPITTTPAALVQYAPPDCRQGEPLAVKLRVSAPVRAPRKLKEVPVALVESTVSGLGKMTTAAFAGRSEAAESRETAAIAAENV